MRLVKMDPDDFPDLQESHRGRVSYPILKMFLESGAKLVMIDRTGVQQSRQSLYSSLNNYIRSKELPCMIKARGNELYLIRTDINDDGEVEEKKIDDYLNHKVK